MNTSKDHSTETSPELYKHVTWLNAVSKQIEIPVLFKKQQAWKHVNIDNIKLIKSSTNKCDLPYNSLVVWIQNGHPVWRYTGGNVRGPSGHYMNTSHLELQQYSAMLYINGSQYVGNVKSLQKLLDLITYTYPILNIVYGIKVESLSSNNPIIT